MEEWSKPQLYLTLNRGNPSIIGIVWTPESHKSSAPIGP
jgi:hypothetical protein